MGSPVPWGKKRTGTTGGGETSCSKCSGPGKSMGGKGEPAGPHRKKLKDGELGDLEGKRTGSRQEGASKTFWLRRGKGKRAKIATGPAQKHA